MRRVSLPPLTPVLSQITKVIAAYIQAQLQTMNKAASALQREEYKLIELFPE